MSCNKKRNLLVISNKYTKFNTHTETSGIGREIGTLTVKTKLAEQSIGIPTHIGELDHTEFTQIREALMSSILIDDEGDVLHLFRSKPSCHLGDRYKALARGDESSFTLLVLRLPCDDL